MLNALRGIALLIAVAPLQASAALPKTGLPSLDSAAGGSAPLRILLLLTLLTVLPAILMAATPFLRITIVLHFLRQALGTQTAPSNQVLLGLALFLTLLVISPTVNVVYEQAWVPYESGGAGAKQAFDLASPHLRTFFLKFAREKDIRLFLELSKTPAPARPEELDLKVLVPAYILSEMRAGFQVGAVLFLPFLVIDLVIASLTLSAGMVQLPPVMLSAPFKILLFVLVDGWNLVVGSLVRSFY